MLSHFSHVQLFATLWAVALQAPLTMGFSRDHPDPGMEFTCLTSPALAGMFFITSATQFSLNQHLVWSLEPFPTFSIIFFSSYFILVFMVLVFFKIWLILDEWSEVGRLLFVFPQITTCLKFIKLVCQPLVSLWSKFYASH